MHLRLTLFLSVLSLLIIFVMNTCCPDCDYIGTDRGGLTRHKHKCQLYSSWQAKIQTGRRADDTAQQPSRPDAPPPRKKKKKGDLASRLRQASALVQKSPVAADRSGMAQGAPPLHGGQGGDLEDATMSDAMDVDPAEDEREPSSSQVHGMDVDAAQAVLDDDAGPATRTRARLAPRRIPAPHTDILPDAIPLTTVLATPAHPPEAPPSDSTTPPSRPAGRLHTYLRSALSVFGLYREYPSRPTYDPENNIDLNDISNVPRASSTKNPPPINPLKSNPATSTSLFANETEEMLCGWLNNGNTLKTPSELNTLVHEVLRHPHFRFEDLKGFDAQIANRRADEADKQAGTPFGTGFRERAVTIDVPSGDKTVPPERIEVPGLHYRRIMDVLREALQDPVLSPKYHLFPFRLFRRASDGNGAEDVVTSGMQEPSRIYSEVYNSDAMLEAHEEVQSAQLPPEEQGCKRPRIVSAMMAWSDSTHLANFGNAHVWPIYLMLGNLSKYIRCQPTSGACLHLAYIPSLSAETKRRIAAFHAKWDTQQKQILTHCKRELMQAVWAILLEDDEFLKAYRYGFVMEINGTEYRVYPRLFTYSADYPEKVLLATIRDKGICVCPRCLMPRDKLERMGMVSDMKYRLTHARTYLKWAVERARDMIYKLATPITGPAVERLLKATSSVPTKNAFKIDELDDIDVSRFLVVDFMHEFELGVWKAFFTHSIRLLYAIDSALVKELDRRFAAISTFGVDTIRRFHENVSEMKKLAARDFEDILQCSIPAFEGLLPDPHNKRLLKVLYKLAEWHALAKLRLHTEETLARLEVVTRELGQAMRDFRDNTCSAYKTFETPSEIAARERRKASEAKKAAAAGKPATGKAREPRSKVPKTLNLATYKWHALGDYVSTIRLFGPTDNYSTQAGELAHRVVKRLYGVTNKKQATAQIGRAYRRMVRARRAQAVHDSFKAHTKRRAHQAAFKDNGLYEHHHITKSRNVWHTLSTFPSSHQGDPAIEGFVPKLQDHLLTRLLHRKFDGDDPDVYTSEERNQVRLQGRKFYEGRTCRINYTTYDCRRDQDTIHVGKNADIMMLSPETEEGAHPYWYARVLGIYHADVSTSHPLAPASSKVFQPMQFLFVRWYGFEPRYRCGSHLCKLPKIGFVEESQGSYAFGFLDPALVLRCCHLIPSFVDLRTDALLHTKHPSIARPMGETDDWLNYYVNVFADRDMLMRFFAGGGVGHAERRLTPAEVEKMGEPEEEAECPAEEEEDDEADASMPAMSDVEQSDVDMANPDPAEVDDDDSASDSDMEWGNSDDSDEDASGSDEDGEAAAEEELLLEGTDSFEDSGYASY